jgi:hypothetical protein
MPALLVLVVSSGCAPGVHSSTHRVPEPTAPAHNRIAEMIWLAVLQTYSTGAVSSEGDVTLGTNRSLGVGEQSSRAPLVLMTHTLQRQTAYRRAWLDTLVRLGAIRNTCDASQAKDCPDSVMTSFLSLSDPNIGPDSAATVMVSDEALNPTACRRKAGASMGGFMSMQFDLARENGNWRVMKKQMGSAGTTVCGFTAEEEAGIARLEREDSLLRQTKSPVAGTYRVTVTFGSGDSSVFYARTELHPMSSIRERRRDDVQREDYQPIIGYYLATCSAPSLDSLPPTFSYPCLQSYYAVSVDPILTETDSTLWHGEIEPLVEVVHLDSRGAVRSEAQSLFGASEERGQDWYFMPGTWVTYTDGHVRHDWTVAQAGELAYRVRANRISQVTLASRSR